MEYFNNNEVFKNVKKTYIFLHNSNSFNLSASLRNLNHALTPDGNETVISTLPETTKLNIQQVKNKSGIYWKNRIVITTIEGSNDFQKHLDKFINKKVVLGMELFDGRIFIYGNTNQPLEIIYKELNPTKKASTSGYEITFNGNTTTPPRETNLQDFNYNPFLTADLPNEL